MCFVLKNRPCLAGRAYPFFPKQRSIDAVSGVVFSACLPVSQSLRSDARCCNGRVSRLSPCVSRVSCLSPCVSQSLRSDARCCDAGSGVVSPACLSLCDAGSGASLCLPAPDAVTPAPGLSPACLPLPVSSCLVSHQCRFLLVSLSLWSECCDAGSGVVSPACLPVSRSLCDAVTLAPGSCLPLVSVSFCGQRPDVVTPAPGRSHACLPVSPSLAVRC